MGNKVAKFSTTTLLPHAGFMCHLLPGCLFQRIYVAVFMSGMSVRDYVLVTALVTLAGWSNTSTSGSWILGGIM